MQPYTFEVERVKVKELVEAIGDINPIYVDREAAKSEGFPDTPCPPTFITLAFQEFSGAYFKAFEMLGVSVGNVLHGEEEYEYLAEMYPGDVLTGQMTIDSIIEKQTKSGAMDLITLKTLFSNQQPKEEYPKL